MHYWRRAAPLLAAGAAICVAPTTTTDTFKWKNFIVDKEEIKKRRVKALIRKHMVINGIPGLSIGVTVNGRTVLNEGFGYSDVENGAPCTGQTIMRIASISKSLTSTIAARLVQDGKLDLEAPITKYLPDFPHKQVNGKEVEITSKQLLSHTGGIRHYPEDPEKKTNGNGSNNGKQKDLEATGLNSAKKEFLLNEEFKTVEDAMKIFVNDDLVAEPGTKFSYTTHGFTVLSAVLEKASGKTYSKLASELFFTLGMEHSALDNNKKMIIQRTSYYHRNEKHVLENCPEVNNSVKWAGGGMISCVGDLLKFANAILYSYNHVAEKDLPPPLLKRSVLEKFWDGVISTKSNGPAPILAALGWFRVEAPQTVGGTRQSPLFWYHTGAAVGASSVLLISPRNRELKGSHPSGETGICVAMLCNLQDTSLLGLAKEIREIYAE